MKNLVGKWECAEGGGIEVVDSANVFIIYGDQKKQVSSYKTDFSKSPCWFDFTVKDGGQTLTLKSLMLFVNDDLVQWQVFDDGHRPSNFSSDQGEMVYLRRRK
jgi:hypothetical protein